MGLAILFLAAVPAWLLAGAAVLLGAGWLTALAVLTGSGVIFALAIAALVLRRRPLPAPDCGATGPDGVAVCRCRAEGCGHGTATPPRIPASVGEGARPEGR